MRPSSVILGLALGAVALACGAAREREPILRWADNSRIPSDELGLVDAGAIGEAMLLNDAGARAGAPEPPPPPVPTICPRAPIAPPLPPPAARSIRSGPPLTNHIPPEVIQRPVRARAACFRDCYARGLARNPALAGKVAVRFVVDPDGYVRSSKLEWSTLDAPEVERCVVEEMRSLVLQAPDTPVTVVYPMTFGAPNP